METKLKLFKTKDGLLELDVAIDAYNRIWLTQRQLALLFNMSKQNISLHIKGLLVDGSFDGDNILMLKRITSDNKQYLIKHYSFDVLSHIAIKSGALSRYEEICEWCQQFQSLPPMVYIQKRKEYYFKDLLSLSLKGICLVIHQYPVGRYIVDFYIPGYQIIVEYDEAHHSKESSRVGDFDRERELMKILPGINLVRVTVGHEVEGLNQVLKCILGMHDASAP